MLYMGRILCFPWAGYYALCGYDIMLYAGRILCFVCLMRVEYYLRGRILCFTWVGYYILRGQAIMPYMGRTLCFTRVGHYALHGQDIMLYMGRILCYIWVGYYALYMGTENMLYIWVQKICFMRMLYESRILCFIWVGYYVLRWQDIMFYVGRILCIKLVGYYLILAVPTVPTVGVIQRTTTPQLPSASPSFSSLSASSAVSSSRRGSVSSATGPPHRYCQQIQKNQLEFFLITSGSFKQKQNLRNIKPVRYIFSHLGNLLYAEEFRVSVSDF